MPYREGKKWRGAIMVNGRRYTKLLPTKKEAAAWEVNEKRRLSQQPTHTTSLHEAASKYLDFCQKRYVHSTYSEKQKILRELLQQVGNIPVKEVEPDPIQKLIYSKDTPNNCNRARKNLHAFFEYCRKFFGLKYNAVSVIEKLPHTVKEQVTPTEEEVLRILAAADQYDRNLIIACCTTGGRRSEIFRLKWHEDVNFETRTIRLGTRKSKDGSMKYRRVYMNPMLYEALQYQWQTRLPHSDYVFQNRDERNRHYGDRYYYRQKLMRGLCKRAGVRAFGFHALRRFFASLLSDKHKQSLPTIQKLLGHSRPTTTDRYLHGITQAERSAVEEISFENNLHENLHEGGKRGPGD